MTRDRLPSRNISEAAAPATTILITGAGGFVGRYLQAALKDRCPTSRTVLLTAPDDEAAGYVAMDLRDRSAVEAVVAGAGADIVVHLAAQASVARTGLDTAATFEVNLGGSLNLALAMAKHTPDATLLFASSSEVYGESFLSGRVSEETPPRPLNAYAQSKRLAEEMFAAVLPATATVIIARPFNHTGPGQREDFVLPSFANQIARIEAGRQPAVLQVGNLDVRRDILDVRDVVDAYLALLAARDRLPSRVTSNIASGNSVPLRTHVETFRALARVPFDIVVDPARLRASDVPIAEGDPSLLRRLAGWEPRISAPAMVQQLLDAARHAQPA